MTPAARVASAIHVLDEILSGQAAERVLTTWARQNRFAGAKDRAAIRDHVFDALRQLHSSAARGGAMTGRGVMIGLLRGQGIDLDEIFSGQGYAPPPLSRAEHVMPEPPDPLVALDCPAWLAPQLQAALGEDFAPVMTCLQQRAPVFLRVNRRKGTREALIEVLAGDGIDSRPGPLSDTCIEVLENARRVQTSDAYRDGRIEVQDAASQAVSDALDVAPGARVLDVCAGGGGKTLALAARIDARYFAHDSDPGRMADLPERARRAGVEVRRIATADLHAQAPFDLVFADAPCSGSGAWRRSPQAKWTLESERLDALCAVQAGIMDDAAQLVAPDGTLAYLTCSLLPRENDRQVSAFLERHGAWRVVSQRRLTPLDGGDGFFLATFRRIPAPPNRSA